jgi:glycosyltransferase involved in cell wall biosynthesis
MKIAMMVRSYIPVPRPKDIVYANIDLAVDIAEGLARRGHIVDMYAPMGSQLKRAKVQDCNFPAPVHNLEQFRELLFNTDKLIHGLPQLWDEYMARDMFQRAKAGDYDLLHFDHPESALLLAAENPRVPVVYTLHDPIVAYHKEVYELFKTPNQHYISISDNQRRDAPDLPYLRTIHHGIDTRRFAFNEKPEDYLLYNGRIVPEKGVREAIQVAKETKHRLLIIGPTYPDNMDYFDQYIKPNLDDQILYLGYIERNHLPRYYQKAKALLTPVQWEEPFGLTTIEAMSCGTPVVSFNRGAAPEIIVNGKTGYVVNTTVEMIEAIHNIENISRADCRSYIEKNYSIRTMVSNYQAAFEEVLSERQRLSRGFVRKQLSRVPTQIRNRTQQSQLKKIIKESATKPKRPPRPSPR